MILTLAGWSCFAWQRWSSSVKKYISKTCLRKNPVAVQTLRNHNNLHRWQLFILCYTEVHQTNTALQKVAHQQLRFDTKPPNEKQQSPTLKNLPQWWKAPYNSYVTYSNKSSWQTLKILYISQRLAKNNYLCNVNFVTQHVYLTLYCAQTQSDHCKWQLIIKIKN